MTKTVNKRKEVQMPAKIRKKLYAAVCMLLISCIMLVSSTYAWFVLSTAPEVTGITTNVGANGNLEMMLLNAASYASTKENLGVESQVGDSSANVNKSIEESNQTWGNLVDLNSDSYGLSDIVLMPAKLNVDETGKVLASSMLLAPSYGSDGRVIEVKTPTYTGTKTGENFVYSNTEAGVRALGTTSGVTIRLSAYRNALSTASNDVAEALSKAQQSMENNKIALGNMMIEVVLDNGTGNYSSYMSNIKSIIDGVASANTYAGSAIKNSVLAYNLSANNKEEMEDSDVEAMQEAFKTIKVEEGFGTYSVPDKTAESIVSYKNVQSAVTNAQAAYEKIDTSNGVDKTEVQSVLTYLVNLSGVTICGENANAITDQKALLNKIANNGYQADIVLGDGSGVYDDLADMCGPYSVTINKMPVDTDKFGFGMGTMPINATISTVQVNGTINDSISVVQSVGAPSESTGGGTITLGDTYGYALDLGFRTNASSSSLLLQTAEAQRVYAENTSIDATQGAGSYMEFSSINVNTFSVEEVKALMSAIRIAFVTPKTDNSGNYDVLAVGALGVKTTTNQDGTTTTSGGEAVGSTGWKAGIYLYDYSVDANTGAIVLGTQKADKSAITTLEQNVGKKITVVVYLEGETVDNTMVANANRSMTGKLNLQFSSDIQLKPMENSGMRAGGTAAAGSDAAAVTYTEYATAGESLTVKGVTGTVKEGFTIYEGSDTNYYYSMDGNTYFKMGTSNVTDAITITSTGDQG